MGVRPDRLPRLNQPLQSRKRRIDRTLARKHEHVVQPATEETTEEGRHHRDPEVVIRRRPDLMPVAEEVGHESGAEVPCHIDGKPGLPSKAGSDTKEDEEEPEGCEGARAEVPIVLEDVDEEHEDGAGDEFGEELTRPRHEGGRVRAEDACRRSIREPRNGADAVTAFVNINGGLVVTIDDAGGAHGPKDLGEHVHREFSPGEAPEDAVGEGDSRVEVRAGDACGVDAEHDSETACEMTCVRSISEPWLPSLLRLANYGTVWVLTPSPMLWIANRHSDRCSARLGRSHRLRKG